MTVADGVAIVMFTAVILYSVFGGADFGSGVWDLTAGDARRGAATRRLIDHAIGPVWEANHVWLVFILVFLWTGFPGPFAALMRTLAIPFWLAGVGIVARGAGFAFRKYAPTLRWARAAGIAFASASLVTPFFLGAIAGAVASGRVPASADPATFDPGVGLWRPWLGPTSILGGVLAVSTCTFMAGVLLAADAHKLGLSTLADELRRKSLAGAAITGVVVVAGIPVLVSDNRVLVDGLLGRGLPLVLVSAGAGLWTIRLLWRGRYRAARITAAVAVASVVAGWGAAQYPWLLLNEVTIEDGAGADAALIGLLVATGIAAVLVVPPLAYLFSLADSDRVGSERPRSAPTSP
ncbi:MAG: cytochrome d ubiquinol oxidase subunit II [Acidimicrobiales bacterium]